MQLPRNVQQVLGDEPVDFAVLAKRAQPVRKSIGLFIFGFIWTAFSSIFFFAFLFPLFLGKEVHFSSDGVPTTASPQNLEPIILPAIVIGVFLAIGLSILIIGLFVLFSRGGWFVGTPLRLIHAKGTRIRSIDWEQFSGDIEVSAKKDLGNISLKMRTGRMVSRKNAPSQYVPDVLFLSGVPDPYDIERKCRQRIKENDPTPVDHEMRHLQ